MLAPDFVIRFPTRVLDVSDDLDNDMSGSSDDWEKRVWLSALAHGYFTTHHRRGHITVAHASFPIAVAEALQDVECLVYAVSKNERHCSIPRSRWLYYLRWYNNLADRAVNGDTNAVQERTP